MLQQRLAKFAALWIILCIICFQPSLVSGSTRTVANTAELFFATSEADVDLIIVLNTIVINASEWRGTVQLTRSVVISALPERLASQTYTLLDWNNLPMLLGVARNVTLRFVGFEMINHYDALGVNFRPIRQSEGATIILERGISRRLVGLPLSASVANFRMAPRPVGWPGAQSVEPLSDFIYNSTRGPAPVAALAGAVRVTDFATTVPVDNSLAFQGLRFGGFVTAFINGYYMIDYPVSEDCLQQKPGAECIALLLAQLESQLPLASPQPASAALQPLQAPWPAAHDSPGNGRGGGTPTSTIIIAAVVPSAVVLLVIVGLYVHHRHSVTHGSAGGPAAYAPRKDSTGSTPPSGSKAPSAVGSAGSKKSMPQLGSEGAVMKGPTGVTGSRPSNGKEGLGYMAAAAAKAGGVFMGVEDGQEPPVWSQRTADLEAVGLHGSEDPSNRGGGTGGVGSPEQLQTAQEEASSEDPAAAPLVAVAVAVTGGNAASGPGEAGGLEGSSGMMQPALSALSAQDADAPANPGDDFVRVSTGPDMLAELEEMAKGLRTNIRDVQLKLESVLGSGAYGTVYKGSWQGLPVAVKTVVFTASEESRRRALQEAALCQSVAHPNIVATYTSDVEALGGVAMGTSSGPSSRTVSVATDMSKVLDWRLYIVQEFCDGGPLRALYGDRTLWPGTGLANLPSIVSLGLGISRALAHLHSKRIIHGDLNPNNVLLKRDPVEPSGYGVKVGDFGLSVMLPVHRTHLSNMRMGTMFYICPAVVLKAQVGPASDVFSLGVMLWELYHGRTAGVHTAHGPRYSRVFPAFPPACPPAYAAIARHCLNRQPANRPQAAEVVERLEAVLASLHTPLDVLLSGVSLRLAGSAPQSRDAGMGQGMSPYGQAVAPGAAAPASLASAVGPGAVQT